MTLSQAVDRLRARCRVDLEAEVDLEDNEAAVRELMTAAQEFSRDSYAYWSPRSALTVTVKTGAAAGRFNTLSECGDRMFHCYGVHINGQWLSHYDLPDFERMFSEYWSLSTTSTPGAWTHVNPEEIWIGDPPNSTAAAADDNWCRGFIEHPVMVWASEKDLQLRGAGVYHNLIVTKAALNCTIGNVSSDQGIRRRREYEKDYVLKTERYKSENLARVRPLTKKDTIGRTRRLFGVGHPL